MLARVHKRGRRVGGVLRYLLGPGRAEEHVNDRYVEGIGTAYGRVIAACDGAAHRLLPIREVAGRWDFQPLVQWLEAPVRACGLLDTAGVRGRRAAPWVHHFSVRLAPQDRGRSVSDQLWGHMIREILHGAGLNPEPDVAGCRWLVVRHADDHVHVVTTLVRQDGRREWFGRDMPRLVDATAQVADRMGLRVVRRSGATGHRRPHPAEVRKAARLDRPTVEGAVLTVRDELRRRVRAAAVAAASPEEFVSRLQTHRVRVAFRTSPARPGDRSGVKFALAGDTTPTGGLVWYSGGALAADLTWPKLQTRWTTPPEPGTATPAGGRLRLIQAAEQAAWQATTRPGEVGVWPALGQAAADCLTAGAWLIHGGPAGQLVDAAERLDQAAREPARSAPVRPAGASLRLSVLARALSALERCASSEEEKAVLRMLHAVAVLADQLAWLRQRQGRAEQAHHARHAAATVRARTAAVMPTGPARHSMPTPPQAATRPPGPPTPGVPIPTHARAGGARARR